MSSPPTPPRRPAGDLLGRFLRERRARITVEQAGLPARRTSRGTTTLTQEDLARLTGYSIRTISALEQGSEHRPSRELLDAITQALQLRPDEQATLWYLVPRQATFALSTTRRSLGSWVWWLRQAM